ncbi:NCS2 family permease [Aeromonas simiae]|uniref:NCS2 family permease n=1 Tax=Aeromonas simiae TaxID=218936 RepID=A0A5J6WSF0_9GAMM|nr:NCS2 family permease [Aeromonas simiae]MDO2947506.1 NCS2 family permease [Aeromonas simiae]MDO2951597.1 NCS2 family permease [Aeromonas simiae]MDO2955066.1 NCS2 family permease [Aeromonas simiae]QFI53832.1 NCS2 family permease [Aeromonas simiae]
MTQSHHATGQGVLERLFGLKSHATDAKTEVIAGITTFLTMVYIVFVNPQILSNAGMDTQAVFVTTCLIAGIGSILMGLLANLPIALAPAMGLNAFFAFVVVGGMGYSWQIGMGTIFWGAIGLLILTVFRVRYWLIGNIPLSLRVGITAGIGLLIALLGMHNAGMVVASPATMVTVGKLTSLPCLLGALGFFLICILSSKGIHSAVLIAIAVTTTLGWAFGDVTFQGVVSLPPSIEPVFGQLDLMGSLDIGLAGVIFSFMLVNLFDSSGTLIGVTNRAKLADERGHFPRMKQALMVDSVSSVGGAFMGTSSVTAYIESSSGVAVGGRSGLTAVVVGLLFLLAIFFSPLAAMVPAYAAAGALMYVGVLMSSELTRVEWDDLTEAVPAFMTTVMMPFSFSITEGIAVGFISYCVMKAGTGRWREVNPCVLVVALLFILKFVWVDH